jgi:hypothetical protein
MKAKIALTAAALCGSIAAALVVGSLARAAGDGEFTAQGGPAPAATIRTLGATASPITRSPILQPCPAGYLATPFPSWGNSYKCVPIPAGY